MKYAKLLKTGDTIGVCAPSAGVPEDLWPRLDRACENVRALGYEVLETASVRKNEKCVSADAKTRATEFMSLYENPDGLPGITTRRASPLLTLWKMALVVWASL